MVIAWRILLMTLLSRKQPELPPQVLFSDLEPKVLGAFAAKESLQPPDDLKGGRDARGQARRLQGAQERPASWRHRTVEGLRVAVRYVQGCRALSEC